jgi:hypothetical protein
LADVRFGAHYGLKSDIAPGPKSAQYATSALVGIPSDLSYNRI